MVIEQNSNVDRPLPGRFRKWLGWLLVGVLFGPSVAVYFLGFIGFPLPSGGWFGTWFMGALAVSGVITTVGVLQSVKAHGLRELGCALPIAAATCWWGYLFFKEIGVVQ